MKKQSFELTCYFCKHNWIVDVSTLQHDFSHKTINKSFQNKGKMISPAPYSTICPKCGKNFKVEILSDGKDV